MSAMTTQGRLIRWFIRAIQELPLRVLDIHFRRHRIKVVMFHGGRSGSTVLARMLSRHPNIYWAREFFRTERLKQKKLHATRDNYLRILHGDEFNAGNRLYGFEMKFFHLRKLQIPFDTCIENLKDAGYHRIILLERQNTLRQYISSKIAQQTNVYQVRTERAVKPTSIHLETHNLVEVLRTYQNNVREIKEALRTPYLHLIYEKDVEFSPENAYRKICTFLDLPAATIAPDIRRLNARPLEHLLLNYSDVRQVLEKTEFAWMLYSHESSDISAPQDRIGL